MYGINPYSTRESIRQRRKSRIDYTNALGVEFDPYKTANVGGFKNHLIDQKNNSSIGEETDLVSIEARTNPREIQILNNKIDMRDKSNRSLDESSNLKIGNITFTNSFRLPKKS